MLFVQCRAPSGFGPAAALYAPAFWTFTSACCDVLRCGVVWCLERCVNGKKRACTVEATHAPSACVHSLANNHATVWLLSTFDCLGRSSGELHPEGGTSEERTGTQAGGDQSQQQYQHHHHQHHHHHGHGNEGTPGDQQIGTGARGAGTGASVQFLGCAACFVQICCLYRLTCLRQSQRNKVVVHGLLQAIEKQGVGAAFLAHSGAVRSVLSRAAAAILIKFHLVTCTTRCLPQGQSCHLERYQTLVVPEQVMPDLAHAVMPDLICLKLLPCCCAMLCARVCSARAIPRRFCDWSLPRRWGTERAARSTQLYIPTWLGRRPVSEPSRPRGRGCFDRLAPPAFVPVGNESWHGVGG